MDQSHGDHSLKINITRTIEVSTVPRITEDMIPSYVGAVSSSRVLLPSLGFRGDQYTLIRMFGVEDVNVVEKLDPNIGKVNEVPYIEELSDGSWEICILKSHRRTIKDKLRQIFPGSNVDLYYNPLEPTANDSEIWGHDKAKTLYEERFFERAIRVIKEAWPAGAACYVYRLKVMSGLDADFTLVPTYQGYLQSKEDAVYLLEACISGKLAHSCRGPQDGEATISGNIFVWEANITGIDRWKDGMEWTLWEEDGFEVGKAIDDSGLMKKTLNIPAYERIHHVVSYYTACDAQTLARPSKELDLGSFSNLVPTFGAQPQHHFREEMALHRRHNHQRQGSNSGGDSDGYHTSIASSVDDAEILPLQDGGARCNDGIYKIGMTHEESVADVNEWDDDFDSTPLLERPCS